MCGAPHGRPLIFRKSCVVKLDCNSQNVGSQHIKGLGSCIWELLANACVISR
jgi:hypothetical protein